MVIIRGGGCEYMILKRISYHPHNVKVQWYTGVGILVWYTGVVYWCGYTGVVHWCGYTGVGIWYQRQKGQRLSTLVTTNIMLTTSNWTRC